MTNTKLEVGKRYRPRKGFLAGTAEIVFKDESWVTYVVDGYEASNSLGIKAFLEIYEELPEQPTSAENPQMSQHVASNEHKEGENKNPIISENAGNVKQENPYFKISPEVKVAMEELKEELQTSYENDFVGMMKGYTRTYEKAENLLKALVSSPVETKNLASQKEGNSRHKDFGNDTNVVSKNPEADQTVEWDKSLFKDGFKDEEGKEYSLRLGTWRIKSSAKELEVRVMEGCTIIREVEEEKMSVERIKEEEEKKPEEEIDWEDGVIARMWKETGRGDYFSSASYAQKKSDKKNKKVQDLLKTMVDRVMEENAEEIGKSFHTGGFVRTYIDEKGDIKVKAILPEEIYKEPEPKSIWKDVSELPNYTCDVVIKLRHRKAFGAFMITDKYTGFFEIGSNPIENSEMREPRWRIVDPLALEKYCTLTDFINSFEDLQERVRKLEKEGR